MPTPRWFICIQLKKKKKNNPFSWNFQCVFRGCYPLQIWFNFKSMRPLLRVLKLVHELLGQTSYKPFSFLKHLKLISLYQQRLKIAIQLRCNICKSRIKSLFCLDTCLDTLRVGERGGSVVECRTPEREVGGSKPTATVLCPWARHFTPRKYWLITQEAVGSGGSVPTWLKNCWLGR